MRNSSGAIVRSAFTHAVRALPSTNVGCVPPCAPIDKLVRVAAMSGLRTAQFLMLAMSAACSTEFTPAPCSIDGDCGDGLVCELRDQQPTCVHAEDAPILIGQSAPASGTNQELGTGMKLGIELAFREKNAAGGIRGRELRLEFRDDAYQPDLAEAAARRLLDVQMTNDMPKCPTTSMAIAGSPPVSPTALSRGPNAVLAILGNVGTPTMVRSAPVVIETNTVFFGAFTGASTLLRDNTAGPTCGRYLFNVRASYAQEAEATMRYFQNRGVVDHKHLVSFDQKDSFGQSGYDGLIAAYKNIIGPFPAGTDAAAPFFRARYVRDVEASVPEQVTATQNYLISLVDDMGTSMIPVGILMTDTYGAGNAYIQALRNWQYSNADGNLQKKMRLRLLFSNVSFVGANALAERLKAAGKIGGTNANYTDDVVISQVVPNYQSDSSPVVSDYNAAIQAAGAAPSFTSLEGYIAARVFIAGLERHQGPFLPNTIVETFEKLPDLGFGIGATSGFSINEHQYIQSVWGTVLTADGSFKNLYFWSKGREIQFFE